MHVQIGVPTRGATSTLTKCLSACRETILREGHTGEIVICDQGDDAAERVGSFRSCASPDLTIRYLGVQQKKTLYTLLVQRGLLPQDLTSLLPSHATLGNPGANRNALFLYFAGSQFLSLDDDAIALPIDLREGSQMFASGEQGVVARLRWPASGTALSSNNAELLRPHLSALNLPLRQLLPESQQELKVTLQQLGLASSIDLHMNDGRVLCTMSGVYGHPGIPDMSVILSSSSIKRQTLTRQWLEGWFSTQWPFSVVGTSYPALIKGGPISTTTLTGFANENLLPPFWPFGAGEDTLWGILMSKCFSSSYTLALPVAVRHDQTRSVGQLPVKLTLTSVLRMILDLLPTPRRGEDSNRLLIEAARMCREISTLDTVALQDFLRECFLQVALTFHAQCIRFERDFGAIQSAYARHVTEWQTGLEAVIENVSASHGTLARQDLLSFETQELRSALSLYADLLRSWKDIVDTVKTLKQEGHFTLQ